MSLYSKSREFITRVAGTRTLLRSASVGLVLLFCLFALNPLSAQMKMPEGMEKKKEGMGKKEGIEKKKEGIEKKEGMEKKEGLEKKEGMEKKKEGMEGAGY